MGVYWGLESLSTDCGMERWKGLDTLGSSLPHATRSATLSDAMATLDYAQLQATYGGRYVARRGDRVIADAESYDALCDELDRVNGSWADVVIEYVEPADSVSVY